MSEPVGNSPRANIPSNAHRVREDQATPKVTTASDEPAKEAATKIVTGKVVSRKPPWYKRLLRGMVATDATSIGDLLIDDIIIPGAKRIIRDIVVGSTERVLFGRVQPTVGQNILGNIVGSNVSRISTRYDQMAEGRPMGLDQSQRARHAFNEITLANLDEANAVIYALISRIQDYGAASVADLYGFLGITNPQGNYMDRGFGWTDLSTASVRQTSQGWMLDLPKPEPFRS